MFIGDSTVNYNFWKPLDTSHEDDDKCYYCGGSLPSRSMRFDDGKKWLITGWRFAMIDIDSNNNNDTITCDKVLDETIDIPVPDDQANCCSEPEPDGFSEYCCR